jgi:hypothetical protein
MTLLMHPKIMQNSSFIRINHIFSQYGLRKTSKADPLAFSHMGVTSGAILSTLRIYLSRLFIDMRSIFTLQQPPPLETGKHYLNFRSYVPL